MSKTDYRDRCLKAKGEMCAIYESEDHVVAHHVDGDRNNNAIENLELLCRSCHFKIHSRNPEFRQWWEKLEDDHPSAFLYSDVEQRPLYVRDETWNDLVDELGITVTPELRRMGIRDEAKREIHDALLQVALEHIDELPETLVDARQE